MERKLATVRIVSEIIPIDGADAIELAKIGGWQCVVKKGEFQVDDKGIYFEVDSLLPIDDRFEFLRSGCYKKLSDSTEGFRLRSKRLRGVLSQGLLLPLESFPELGEDRWELWEGEDVTEALRVIKYEPPVPACLSGTVKGNFPSFIKKTNEERVQNLPDWFTKYKDIEFEESLKMDGSSCTVYYNEGSFGVCSRNLDLREDDNNTFWKVAKQYALKERLSSYGRNIAIQGECLGEGIQKNREGFVGHKLMIFNIWLIDEQRHALPFERMLICEMLNLIDIPDSMTLQHVPVYAKRKVFQEFDMAGLIKHAGGPSLNGKIREGLVYKSWQLVNGEPISFKVINNDYLLKFDE